MSNALTVKYANNLPAYLQDESLFQEADKMVGGIGGGSVPYISIKASKFRLVGADGEEALVDLTRLPVIVLTGNEHVSKVYYAGAYDPAAGNAVPPTCFSDNGKGPSSRAASPQSSSCSGCLHNAWGSKVTPTGSQTKACADTKKLAVVIPVPVPVTVGGAASEIPAFDRVYLLRVPAASMKGWRDCATELKNRGVPVSGVILDLGFDADASYPLITFKAKAFASEEQFRAGQKMKDGQAVRDAVGMDDTVAGGASGIGELGAPPAHLSLPVATSGQLSPAAPPQQLNVTPQVIRHDPPPAQGAQEQPARQRGRPPKAQTTQVTNGAAGNGVIQQPTSSNAELDALLASHGIGQG